MVSSQKLKELITDVQCEICGESVTYYISDTNRIYVIPCEDCENDAIDEAYERGCDMMGTMIGIVIDMLVRNSGIKERGINGK